MTPGADGALFVRLADSSMCGRLAAIHGAAFDKEGWDADSFAQLLAQDGTRALVAVETGQEPIACGFVLVRIAADEAEILTLAVVPARRRERIATRLVDSAKRYVAAGGARALFLEVATDNTPARLLYDALGFSQVGLRRGYYERKGALPADAILMRCALAT